MKAMLGALVLAVSLSPAVSAGETPSGAGAGTVTLPLAEFDRLTTDAARPRAAAAAPPEAALGQAHVRVVVDGVEARVRARIDGEVFRDGPVRVPLAADATLVDARLDGRLVPLVRDGTQHAAVLSRRGRFVLDVEIAAKVKVEAGGASVSIPALTAGAVHLTIDLPGKGVDARVDPGVIVRRATVGTRTTIAATLEPARAARLSWTSREPAAREPREVRWFSDVKTLVTLEEADVRLTTLLEVTAIQGTLEQIEVARPEGFDVVDVSGLSLERNETAPQHLRLFVTPSAGPQHRILVVLERASTATTVTPPLLTVTGTQRETGEVAVQGVGTLELTAREAGTMRRIDVRELAPPLRALAQHPLLAAFRYHRGASEAPAVILEAQRYPDAPVLAAVAEQATATTLFTSHGRMLTEIALSVRNHAQPFIRLGLPNDAQLLSAEVAGEKVKPVLGADGTRVPLLRAGFRPSGPYTVSFVYLHAAAPLAKRGDAQLALPRIDIPIGVVRWELFVPDGYRIRARGGNVLPESEVWLGSPGRTEPAAEPLPIVSRNVQPLALRPRVGQAGDIMGTVTDATGDAIPDAVVTARVGGWSRQAVADKDGYYALSGAPAGPLTLTADSPGFRTFHTSDASFRGPAYIDIRLEVGTTMETVTVTAGLSAASIAHTRVDPVTPPSANVVQLQRRVAGVLPVGVEVPRTGTSHRFVRALALDDETILSFRYKVR